MIRSTKRIRLCTALLVCNLVFIWGNSLMPGEVSQAISNWVQEILFDTQAGVGEIPEGNGLLRKLAHFTEFTALGMCFCWLFGMLGKTWKPAFLSGMTAACMDETIQAFVPERAPRILDVGIDSLGVLTGIILVLLGYHFLKKRSAL